MKLCKCRVCGRTGSFYAFRGASQDSSGLVCYMCGSKDVEFFEEADAR